jgi:hypothetical protein
MGALKTYLTWRYIFIPVAFFLLFILIAMVRGGSTEGFLGQEIKKKVSHGGLNGKKTRGVKERQFHDVS